MRARLSALVTSAGLHLALALSLLRPAGALVAPAVAPHRTVPVIVAPPEDETYPGLNPLPQAENAPHFKPGRTSLKFGDTTFDVSRIAERYQALFPFLTPGLSLDLFALTPQDEFTRFLNSLSQRGGREDRAKHATPLALGPGALQALIDRTWSRRDRWEAMQPLLELADRHDPDAGDVPRMFRAYGEQNMGQYYEDRNRSIRDPRLWTELALAADHVSLIAFVRRYASAHPSTRATIELLFILDKTIEGSRNILATLQSTDVREQLNDTRITAPDAYDVILRIQRYYGKVLADRKLRTPDEISAVYDAVRLRVLDGIVSTAPQAYRVGDARFLIGWIHWRAGHVSDALASWCRMSPDPTDVYTDVASRILAELRSPPGAIGSPCATGSMGMTSSRAIGALLKQEESRSWNFQYDRLDHFGYAVDAF